MKLRNVFLASAAVIGFSLAGIGAADVQGAEPLSHTRLVGHADHYNSYHSHYGGRYVHPRSHYGIQRNYYRGHYGGHYDWHDTSHYDWHPGHLRRHGNHFHYVPGHWDFHRDGHWDYHHGH